MQNAVLEQKLRSAHIFDEKKVSIDEAVYALLRNRDRYVEMSAATVGKLPAHPPVPVNRSLVPFHG